VDCLLIVSSVVEPAVVSSVVVPSLMLVVSFMVGLFVVRTTMISSVDTACSVEADEVASTVIVSLVEDSPAVSSPVVDLVASVSVACSVVE